MQVEISFNIDVRDDLRECTLAEQCDLHGRRPGKTFIIERIRAGGPWSENGALELRLCQKHYRAFDAWSNGIDQQRRARNN